MQTLHKRNKDISIIIPVYNLEDFLGPMLMCLSVQDLGSYQEEILFVLNNCTDRSEDVIRESELDCRIITCETQGCGPARNRGLEEATGNYVWMMDGDDWLCSSTAIKDVLDRAYADDLDILRIPFASNYYHWQYFSMVWQYLLRREFISGFRFPDYQPAEDDAYMSEVLAKAGCNRYNHMSLPSMSEQLYFYNFMREGSNMVRHMRGEKI